MSALLATLCSLSMAVATPAAPSAERTQPIVSTHADAHITGHVVDATTGKHIAGATIIIQQYNVSVTTDASGHYSFRNQKPGKLTLTMLADGYLTQVKEVTLQKGETLEVNFDAVLDDTQLEEVVVTANRQRTLRRYAPTLVSVIDNKSSSSTMRSTSQVVLPSSQVSVSKTTARTVASTRCVSTVSTVAIRRS